MTARLFWQLTARKFGDEGEEQLEVGLRQPSAPCI